METVNKIGPMVCVRVEKIITNNQDHSMQYYKIVFPGAVLAATALHAFKVIRDGKELYLPTDELKADDNIWIDRSAFMADGSLTLKEKKCVPEDTKVFVPIENIVTTKETVHFTVASTPIQATRNHTFDIKRNGKQLTKRADRLRAGDLFKVALSLLTPGNKVFGTDKKLHVIK